LIVYLNMMTTYTC